MSKSKTFVWIIWFTASIFYAYQYIIRVMPNIMFNEITEQFNIDSAIFGQFSGIYYIGYSIVHIPIGIMLDRYGPRKVITICILLNVAGLAPIIFAENWVYPIIGRLLIGIGSSAAILGVFKIIRSTFAEKYFTRMLSFSVTIGLIGAIYGGGPVSYLLETYGHKTVVQIFALVGIMLAIFSYLIIPEIKDNHKETVIDNMRDIFSNKKVILVCLLAGFMVGPLEGFADVWGAEFLKKIYGFEKTTANTLPSMIFLGMCFGAPVLSFIAEKSKLYLGTIIGSAVVMFIIFIMLLTNNLTINSMTIAFALVGICCAYQILAIYKVSTYVPENSVGIATAVANMIIMFFGYFFHSVIGLVIRKYSLANQELAFIYGVSIIPIALAIAIIGFTVITIDENRRLHHKK